MFIKLENGQPTGNPLIDQNMWYLFPNFNWNRVITPNMIAELGYGIFEFTQIPQAPRYTKIAETKPALNANNGIWYQQWETVDMNQDEKNEVNVKQAINVRYQRNGKLQETDWVLLPDSPLSDAMKQTMIVYRQQLRDVTEQSGFPWDVVWPNNPLEN
jgi:hypothetical protein